MISSISKTQSKNYPIQLQQVTHETLRCYFEQTWEIYEWLFSAIKDDQTYYEAPDPLRNPLIFYWGHTAAFYINKLKMAGLISNGINEHYEELFAKGVDPNLPENLEVHDLWPTKAAVDSYRLQVKHVVLNCLQEQYYPVDSIDDQHPLWALLMGIEHDRIHFETSSMLLRQLPVDKVQRPEDWNYATSQGQAPKNELIAVDATQVTLGKSKNNAIYGWDNEYGTLTVDVPAFEASKNLISNQEFLDFYNSGAYNDERYWTTEGWAWKTRTATQQPKFWVKTEEGFAYRAMFDVLDMPLDFPVEVNAHEAWAYCAWKGKEYRLMSEGEFNAIAQHEVEGTDCAVQACYNLNMKYGSPSPVGSNASSTALLGFNDLYGNVWDWLNNDFYPLPNFKIHPWYEDFSAPYFDNEHSMLLGGAWATTGSGASKYYRLWFRRHFYQHAGFRIARSL